MARVAAHSHIAAFMDNDEAGQNTLQKIIDNVPETTGNVCVYDIAKLYEGYNDPMRNSQMNCRKA